MRGESSGYSSAAKRTGAVARPDFKSFKAGFPMTALELVKSMTSSTNCNNLDPVSVYHVESENLHLQALESTESKKITDRHARMSWELHMDFLLEYMDGRLICGRICFTSNTVSFTYHVLPKWASTIVSIKEDIANSVSKILLGIFMIQIYFIACYDQLDLTGEHFGHIKHESCWMWQLAWKARPTWRP